MARKTIKVESIVERMVYDYFECDHYNRKALAFCSDEYIGEDGKFTEYSITERKACMNMRDYYHDKYRTLESLLSDFVDFSKYDEFIDASEDAMEKGLKIGNVEVAKQGFMEVWERLA